MFTRRLAGLPSTAAVVVISDFAWNEHGSFCRIGEASDLTLLSDDSYTVVHPRWLVIGNRDQFEGNDLQQITVPSGKILYWTTLNSEGSVYSHVYEGQLAVVDDLTHIGDLAPEALSYIGLCDEDLRWAATFARQQLNKIDKRFGQFWQN